MRVSLLMLVDGCSPRSLSPALSLGALRASSKELRTRKGIALALVHPIENNASRPSYGARFRSNNLRPLLLIRLTQLTQMGCAGRASPFVL